METVTLNAPVDRLALPGGSAVAHEAARDGWPLRVFDWPLEDARGELLFLGGRGDIFEKYVEAFHHWRGQGWHVTSFDWRGQGGSGRFGSDPMVGHVEAFGPWIDDLADRFERLDASGPRVIVAHSMGGHLTLRALVEKRIAPDAAVLVAPMLGLRSAVPQRLALQVSRLMTRIGPPERLAWRSGERPALPGGSRRALLTHSPERYADEMWWREAAPELAIGPPSWRWLVLAFESTLASFAPGKLEAVETPILLLCADADGLVEPRAIHAAAKRLPNARLIRFGREAAHELLREADPMRTQAMTAIDRFFDSLPGTGRGPMRSMDEGHEASATRAGDVPFHQLRWSPSPAGGGT